MRGSWLLPLALILTSASIHFSRTTLSERRASNMSSFSSSAMQSVPSALPMSPTRLSKTRRCVWKKGGGEEGRKEDCSRRSSWSLSLSLLFFTGYILRFCSCFFVTYVCRSCSSLSLFSRRCLSFFLLALDKVAPASGPDDSFLSHTHHLMFTV